MATLTGKKVKDTYYKVLQVDNGQIVYNGLGSPVTGSVNLSGSLHVTGSQTIGGDLRVFGNVTAKQFIATTVSSSVIYESGSSEFGNSIDDTHTFTGSLYISNSIDLTGDQTITGTLTLGDYTDVSASLKQAEDDIITNSASAHVARGQLSASAHLSRTQLSSSADVARTALSSSTHTARRSEIGDLSGSAHTARRSEISDLSGSAHDQRLAISSSTATNIRAEITALSASVDEVSDAEHASRIAELNASSSALITAFTDADTTLSSSAHDQRVALIAGTTSDITALSSSAHTARVNLSSSVDTHIDAKLAGLVDSAPATLDTLNELAAALGDDPNVSASFATTLGTKFATADHNTYSGSAASAIRAEYVAGDTAISTSADIRRNELSSSVATALRSEYVAGDTALSSSTATALRSEYVAADTTLSSSAHTQRIALSSSAATAFRTEYTDGDVTVTSTLNTYTASANSRLDSIEASTSSYVTNSQTSSMTVLSSSYAISASYATSASSIEYTNILNKPDLETSASVAADYISIERLKALVAAAPTYNDFSASIALL